ncbi:hypothetical protein IGS74_10275 [Aureimonas sp. OT7]|uniref:hypothetical protein n=1 Tax=Aureimonas altamirensis TaxID=370622 RepID=UPI0017828CC2|nr:hypothetical protein IGS74_10275 [Aureimonas sp. OT7]
MLDMLEWFGTVSDAAHLSDVARALNMPKSSALLMLRVRSRLPAEGWGRKLQPDSLAGVPRDPGRKTWRAQGVRNADPRRGGTLRRRDRYPSRRRRSQHPLPPQMPPRATDRLRPGDWCNAAP